MPKIPKVKVVEKTMLGRGRRLEIYQGKDDGYRWRVISGGNIVGCPGEGDGYKTIAKCRKGLHSALMAMNDYADMGKM